MQPENRLKAYAKVLEGRLERLLPGPEVPPRELHEAMRYSCLAPGKRLRPALCMASAEAVGGLPESLAVLDAASALEMVHCFSLIHDDLPAIDDDELRRGMPTCHVKFGEALALLAGDALFSLAFEVISSTEGPPERTLRAVRILAEASGSDGLVGGEVMDVLAEGRAVEKDTLEYIHSRKTGALISASCELGGLLGGGTREEVEQLKYFGSKLGLAFQVVDDLLNETSTKERLGKAAGSDKRRQKATYPGLYGIEGAQTAANAFLIDAIAALKFRATQPVALIELAEFCVARGH